jgi:hypothetical protein
VRKRSRGCWWGHSRFLILLASPEAGASHWVNKEVAYWLEHESADTLLIAVTDGALAWDNATNDFTWNEAMPLPRALKGRFVAEPKWVDLAAHRDGADKRDAKFTELAADFAAAIRGMPKEDLLSQEVRQQRRALSLAIPTFRAKIPRDSAAHASGRRPRYRGCRNVRPGADLSRIQRRRTRGGREGLSPHRLPGGRCSRFPCPGRSNGFSSRRRRG